MKLKRAFLTVVVALFLSTVWFMLSAMITMLISTRLLGVTHESEAYKWLLVWIAVFLLGWVPVLWCARRVVEG